MGSHSITCHPYFVACSLLLNDKACESSSLYVPDSTTDYHRAHITRKRVDRLRPFTHTLSGSPWDALGPCFVKKNKRSGTIGFCQRALLLSCTDLLLDQISRQYIAFLYIKKAKNGQVRLSCKKVGGWYEWTWRPLTSLPFGGGGSVVRRLIFSLVCQRFSSLFIVLHKSERVAYLKNGLT